MCEWCVYTYITPLHTSAETMLTGWRAVNEDHVWIGKTKLVKMEHCNCVVTKGPILHANVVHYKHHLLEYSCAELQAASTTSKTLGKHNGMQPHALYTQTRWHWHIFPCIPYPAATVSRVSENTLAGEGRCRINSVECLKDTLMQTCKWMSYLAKSKTKFPQAWEASVTFHKPVPDVYCKICKLHFDKCY